MWFVALISIFKKYTSCNSSTLMLSNHAMLWEKKRKKKIQVYTCLYYLFKKFLKS